MRRGLKQHGKWLSVIAFLMLSATLAGGYILVQQRLTNPFADFYTVNAEFSTTAGLNPGLGQAVNVAGVRVGTISSSTLKDGSAIVEMQVKPGKLKHIFKDAHAVLVPNSPLKDMQVELFPGGAEAGTAPDGFTIPVARTAPPVDSDELTAALDTDTRRFFQVLVSGVDHGLDGRAKDLQAILKTLEPTAKDLREVTGALAGRRRELRRLVHSMAVLTTATATKDEQLAQVIQGGNATLQALAGQEAALRRSARKLPAVLTGTSRTLTNLEGFTRELRPTLDGLLPTVRKLKPVLKATDDLAVRAEPVLRTQLRPLVRELQPVAAALSPTTRDLSRVTPALSSAFRVLNYTVNELAHNPEGDDEGFLFWLAWFAHNGNSFTSIQDAHGSAWRGVALLSCDSAVDTLGSLGGAGAILAPIIKNIIDASPVCR
jgi:phospholipid/cholesterol/gamma-HCH transport system substrate-binding protein